MRAREIIRPAAEVTEESSTTKPSGSLNADEWRRKSERRLRSQQQMNDENERHAKKMRDLQERPR
jgi:hypothetical protein